MPDDQLSVIEAGVNDLMTAFDVTSPPVPVEIMLQRPKAGMWKEINLSELSTAFINIRQRYSPRMSVARLLARNVCRSEWGTSRHLDTIGSTDEGLRTLARAILMPRSMIEALAPASRTPIAMSMRFEVPEDDAKRRLTELGYMVSDEPQPLP
jgi:hypothetical protein